MGKDNTAKLILNLQSFMNSLFRLFTTSSRTMAAEAMPKVQSLIDESPVVVFSKSYCPYCKSTKSTLQKTGIDFKVIELDQISGQRTVPNVYIKQKHIGGNSDVQALDKSGKLQGLLKEAGVV